MYAEVGWGYGVLLAVDDEHGGQVLGGFKFLLQIISYPWINQKGEVGAGMFVFVRVEANGRGEMSACGETAHADFVGVDVQFFSTAS